MQVFARKPISGLHRTGHRRQERRLGEMLREMEKNEGGRPVKTGCTMQPVSSLADLGIEKAQAHRWQLEATVPEGVFSLTWAANVTGSP